MEAQKLPPITTNRERTSGSSWPHQKKILLVITLLPECGIVLNRCIANRFFHLGSNITKHEPRYLCTCYFSCRGKSLFGSSQEPPCARHHKAPVHSLLPLILPHTAGSVDLSAPTFLLPLSEGSCNPSTASIFPTAAQLDLVDGAREQAVPRRQADSVR